ncbi:MAG: hypothetical protein AB1641_05705 [Thermodesulfobacteriota bacterium]
MAGGKPWRQMGIQQKIMLGFFIIILLYLLQALFNFHGLSLLQGRISEAAPARQDESKNLAEKSESDQAKSRADFQAETLILLARLKIMSVALTVLGLIMMILVVFLLSRHIGQEIKAWKQFQPGP